MSGRLGDLVAQLLAVRERLDRAVVTATRAQADAEQALAHLSTVGGGTSDRDLAAAVVDARTAGEKAGRYARLLATATEHLTTYINVIAPGSTPTNSPADTAAPSGERLVSEAERRGRRADIAWRKQLQKADDTEDSLKGAEKAAKDTFNYLKQQFGSGGSTSTGSKPPPTSPPDRPQVDNPITSAVMAAGALAVVAKSVWNHVRNRRRAKERDDGDQ